MDPVPIVGGFLIFDENEDEDGIIGLRIVPDDDLRSGYDTSETFQQMSNRVHTEIAGDMSE